ncbi:hypothetical protein GUITHDRAFT_117628 [Guillardia theta CCMP2712]|uniref:Uncharacterized protein n=1 Tax=Guillardia theta (strain CCMP2712) TaxID=905079 RepID=L1IJL7_GUITC|nr:hypothetical protein GUITHDRAFT_117628 [Guillardia theta CCMP2712]EKX36124.1 hypothetical protein GUITHDRAFT_117628 [Guillardia theta CCMP2712]|eukprot:XP_005823104.1 hypothetical protein GUITHDRAFT_117628 [Guillardia theta CCMP2712]
MRCSCSCFYQKGELHRAYGNNKLCQDQVYFSTGVVIGGTNSYYALSELRIYGRLYDVNWTLSFYYRSAEVNDLMVCLSDQCTDTLLTADNQWNMFVSNSYSIGIGDRFLAFSVIPPTTAAGFSYLDLDEFHIPKATGTGRRNPCTISASERHLGKTRSRADRNREEKKASQRGREALKQEKERKKGG